MALWRCTSPDCAENDGPHPAFDFEAAGPVCPKCGADGRARPGAVLPRACIHYLVSDPGGKIRTPSGNRLVACAPDARQIPEHAAGYHAAVTCPACRASEVFRAHQAADTDQHQDIVRFTPHG